MPKEVWQWCINVQQCWHNGKKYIIKFTTAMPASFLPLSGGTHFKTWHRRVTLGEKELACCWHQCWNVCVCVCQLVFEHRNALMKTVFLVVMNVRVFLAATTQFWKCDQRRTAVIWQVCCNETLGILFEKSLSITLIIYFTIIKVVCAW